MLLTCKVVVEFRCKSCIDMQDLLELHACALCVDSTCTHALGWLKKQNVSLSSGTWLLKSSYRNMPNLVNVKSYCTDAQLVLVRLYLFTDHTAICYSLCMNVWCSCIFQDTKSPQDSSINFISNIDIISHHLKVNLLQWFSIPRCLYKVHSAVCLVWG